jgi:hypothetical protein
MTKQSDIPGMEHGMFFEHYVFDPISNFTEADLYHVVKLFNIKFDDKVEPPHQQHFDGKVFVPDTTITVIEFTDILTELGLVLADDILNKLPEELQTQFEDGKFVPFDDFGLDDLILFLTKCMNFRLGTTEFNTLPKKIKRQFIVFTRDGKHWRYGDRTPSH